MSKNMSFGDFVKASKIVTFKDISDFMESSDVRPYKITIPTDEIGIIDLEFGDNPRAFKRYRIKECVEKLKERLPITMDIRLKIDGENEKNI